MASVFAGSTRALLTSIVFALESTMQPHGLLPLLGASIAAYFVSFFLMKHGTIMTEKINRRGVHTPDAFEPDILQRVNVGAVIEDPEDIFSADNSLEDVREWMQYNGQNIEAIPVVDENEAMVGIVKLDNIRQSNLPGDTPITAFVQKKNIYVYTDSKLSFAVDLMDRFKLDCLPVVERNNKTKVVGILSYKDVFAAYRHRSSEENIYKRAISLRRQGYKFIVRGKQLLKG